MKKLLTKPLRTLTTAVTAFLISASVQMVVAQAPSLATTRDSATKATTVLVQGAIGTRGNVQVSENLSSWTDLGPFVLAGAPFPVVDAQSVQRPVRFYRLTTAASSL